MSSQTAAAPEEQPEEQLSPPVAAQTASEPLLPIRTSAAILPVSELSEESVASAAHPAQEETSVLSVQVFPVSTGDSELREAQGASASVPVISTPQLQHTVSTTATSQPLNSVVPVLSPPAQTPQAEVEYLKGFPFTTYSLF